MTKCSPSLKLTFLFNILFIVSIITSIFKSVSPVNDISCAYLDPGTGSMVISAIIGVFATLALGLKTFWYKIARFFKPGSKADAKKTTDTNKK